MTPFALGPRHVQRRFFRARLDGTLDLDERRMYIVDGRHRRLPTMSA